MTDSTSPRIVRILARALVHVAKHVSTDESRPVLHGIYVEPSGIIVATNGHTLACWRNAAYDAPAVARHVILSRAALSACAKPKAAWLQFEEPAADVQGERNPILATVHDDKGRNLADAAVYDSPDLASGYPKWRSVVPRGEPDNVTRPLPFCNVGYLHRFAVDKGWPKDGPRFTPGTEAHNAVLVTYPTGAPAAECVGVVMPIRDMEETARVAPRWVFSPTPDQRAEGDA